MRRLIATLALIGIVGCQSPTLPTITNVNTNTNILNGGGGIQDPNAVAAACSQDEETPIRVDLNVPVSATVGESTGIDATPKSANGKRKDGCNILQGILWTTFPSDVCTVPNPSEFNTVMKCLKPGNCQMTASVPGHAASGTATVACQ